MNRDELPAKAVKLSGPEQANKIANHPSVYPFVSVAPGPLVIGGGARIYDGEGCSFVFLKQQPCVWHLHTLSLPEARGRGLVMAARDAANALFAETDCLRLLTMTPDDAPHARPPKTFGFVEWFRRADGFARNNCGFSWYELGLERWIVRSKRYRQIGKVFHDLLHQIEDHEHHTEDPAHDANVGFAIDAAMSGQRAKGVAVYNSWSELSGYHPLSKQADGSYFTGDSFVKITDKLEVRPCQ